MYKISSSVLGTYLKKTINFFSIHSRFLFFLFCSFIVLWLINPLFWLTTDEYFYSIITRSFVDAAQGKIFWGDIVTEHVAFVPFLSFLFNSAFHPVTVYGPRVVIFFFSLGIMAVLYAIGKHMQLAPKERLWMLWLLLLLPGFWVFSVRIMLDIPAVFAIALIVYLLVKKAPSYQVGLGVLLLLLLKEYYVYLIVPLIMVIYITDALQIKAPWYKKIWSFIGNIIIIYLPVSVVSILLIDFNFFPYPRLLENSLEFIFGDIYIFGNKVILLTMQKGVHAYQFFSVALHNAIGVDSTSVISTAESILSFDTTNTLNNAAANSAAHTQNEFGSFVGSLEDKIKFAQYSGQLPIGIVESNVPAEHHDFFQKWWLIYQYNFSEQDINIFVLPLTSIGIAISLQRIRQSFYHAYDHARTDIIFVTLLLVFLYFNYHEANNIYGFRVTLPIILSLVYFSYLGAIQLLHHFSKRFVIAFGVLSACSILLYWISLQQITYGSLLANASPLGILLAYKPFIFIGIFILITIGIILFPKIRFRYRYHLLACIMVVLFAIKFFPFFLDNQQSIAYYGYDYSMAKATPYLRTLTENDARIYSHIHPYKLQYYSEDSVVAHDGTYPRFRTFRVNYKNTFFYFPLDPNFITNLRDANIDYVFFVNTTYNGEEFKLFQDVAQLNPELFEKIEEYSHGGHSQWLLYRFHPESVAK